MSAKSRGSEYEPSWTEVTIGALLSVMLGAVLGAAFLVFKPVLSTDVMKERAMAKVAKPAEAGAKPQKPGEVTAVTLEPTFGEVFYIEGTRDTAKSRLAAAKRKTFVAGGSITLDENELNTLVGSAPAVPPKPAPPPGKPGAAPKAPEPKPGAADAAADGLGVVQGAPNFRIQGGELQIGVPMRIGALGFHTNVIVQARGQFVKRREAFEFEPTTFLVGSCPVSPLPIVSSFVSRHIRQNVTVPEDLAEAWGKLSEVALVGSTLKLTMP